MSSNLEWIDRLPEAFRHWLDGRRLDEVECIVSDLAGVARGKAMPAAKFAKSEQLYLPISIFFQTITGGYADFDDDLEWTEADLVLVPDFEAATAVPWTGDVTLQVVHDIYDSAGKPLGMSPRNVLKRVVALYHAQGWKPVVAPELEFYLTKPNVDPNMPIEPPIGRTGRKGVGRQAYSMSAVDEYGLVIDDIYDFAEAQGFEIDTIIQEGGAGQIEINLMHGDPLALADQVFFYKRSIREAALRNECFATFMAKPMEDQPGSAMHIHQSVVDFKTGQNLFSAENGEPTALFDGFLGGQQKHLPAALAVLAPYVNSYRRFVVGGSAPINLEWGKDNRSAGLRVPLSKPEARRVENRVAGMDCNPYLAIAASLACGYLGMMAELKPTQAVRGDAYSNDGAPTLTRDLYSSLEVFEQDIELREMLGPDFCKLYKTIKRYELEEFNQVISPWERDHLLLNV
ncbi:MAG: glutamine synthetase family protein [Granulosicoccaceae bacterium]